VTADRLGTNFPTDSAVALWEREFQGIPTLMAVTLLEAAERAGFGQSRELLRRAERYMNDSAMPASGWTARTNALAARFAAQEGRRADATVRRHEVVRVCEELDNRSLLEQLITLEPQTEVALRAAAAPSLQIELHDFGAIAEIRCTAPNGRQLEFSSPVPRPLIRRGGGNYSTDALKMWATEPRRLAGLLADLIDFHRVGALIEDLGMPTDLALVLPRGPWAALPVEGAMDARGLHSGPLLYRTDPSALGLNAAVAWAQSALSELLGLKVIPDGIFGTMTEQAVEQYQRGNGLVATGLLDATTRRHLRNSLAKARGRSGLPRVLILQRSREGERFSKESYGAIGLAVADLYEECNVPALAIEPPYPHELVNAVPTRAGKGHRALRTRNHPHCRRVSGVDGCRRGSPIPRRSQRLYQIRAAVRDLIVDAGEHAARPSVAPAPHCDSGNPSAAGRLRRGTTVVPPQYFRRRSVCPWRNRGSPSDGLMSGRSLSWVHPCLGGVAGSECRPAYPSAASSRRNHRGSVRADCAVGYRPGTPDSVGYERARRTKAAGIAAKAVRAGRRARALAQRQ
jgi:peptidoglycan hydrolase-like protein with peptidoglycan-binding domain